MKGRWIKTQTGQAPSVGHVCQPPNFKEAKESGAKESRGSYEEDQSAIWECPDPDCGRWWLLLEVDTWQPTTARLQLYAFYQLVLPWFWGRTPYSKDQRDAFNWPAVDWIRPDTYARRLAVLTDPESDTTWVTDRHFLWGERG